MARSTSTEQIIFGRNAVVEAINNGEQIDKVFLQRGTRGEFEKEIRNLCKAANIPVKMVPKEKLGKFTKGNHQGVVALHALIPYFNIEDIIPGIYEKSEVPLIVVLDRVTDVRNFGAIARSAEVMGAHAIVIPQTGSALINSEAIKTSAGALLTIPVCRVKSLVNTIEDLKLSGLAILASDLSAKQQLQELDLNVPLALVLGSEGEGISNAIRNRADQLFIIPQYGKTDSLNVSVAGGIALYEIVRQRNLQ